MDEAIAAFRELVDDKRGYSAATTHTPTTRGMLATRLAISGAIQQARDAYRKLDDDRRRVLRSDHPATAPTMRDSLATMLGKFRSVRPSARRLRIAPR